MINDRGPYRSQKESYEDVVKRIETENKILIELPALDQLEFNDSSKTKKFLKLFLDSIKMNMDPTEIVFYSPDFGLFRFKSKGNNTENNIQYEYQNEQGDKRFFVEIEKNKKQANWII